MKWPALAVGTLVQNSPVAENISDFDLLAIGEKNSHLVSDGSFPVWRAIETDVDTGSDTAVTSSYLTMSGHGPTDWDFASEIEVTVTTGTEALVLFKADLSNNTGGSQCRLSYSVSGATTVAASDLRSVFYESSNAGDGATLSGFDLAIGLTAGSNVFTLEGRVSADTGTIARPEIAVIAF